MTVKRYANVFSLCMARFSFFGTRDSREVAEMVEKRHDHLMRDIETYVMYIEEMDAPKVWAVDFFTESAYIDAKGETRKCYLITKRGCEMIANKLTGAKGVQFTAYAPRLRRAGMTS